MTKKLLLFFTCSCLLFFTASPALATVILTFNGPLSSEPGTWGEWTAGLDNPVTNEGNVDLNFHWNLDTPMTDFHWGGDGIDGSSLINDGDATSTWDSGNNVWVFENFTINKSQYFHIESSGLTGSHQITATPEPATIVLLGLGGLALRRRRK